MHDHVSPRGTAHFIAAPLRHSSAAHSRIVSAALLPFFIVAQYLQFVSFRVIPGFILVVAVGELALSGTCQNLMCALLPPR